LIEAGCRRATGHVHRAGEDAIAMPGTYVVRYGQMRFLGEYRGIEGEDHPRGQSVIVQSDRGLELGEVLCPATDRSTMFLENPFRGDILRVASDEDMAALSRLSGRQKEGFQTCRELIAHRRLQMDLVDVEAVFGGERMVFYYLAEKRVDFRELVKDLARAFRTRIEMRQIGVRDEAKLLADYGDCGKPVCCNTHLSRMPPVSMRMAKIQKTTLDPSKISGRCGRLKCCLRYEFDTYQAIERELPSVGAKVTTGQGRGRVLALEILTRKIVIEYEDRRRVVLGVDDITGVEKPRGRLRHDDREDDDMIAE
jgi:cell fate regulator YaaT (PSP1 superfamily)